MNPTKTGSRSCFSRAGIDDVLRKKNKNAFIDPNALLNQSRLSIFAHSRADATHSQIVVI